MFGTTGATPMRFCSEGERLGSNPNTVWQVGTYGQRIGLGSVGGKLLRGSIRGKGDSG